MFCVENQSAAVRFDNMSGKTSDYADDGGDSDLETDPGQLLDEWLGELSNLSGGLDVITSSGQLRPPNVEITTPRIDRYRFSMANLEDSQDVDLDAILGELNVLENQCTIELNNARDSKLLADAQKLSTSSTQEQLQHLSRAHNRNSSEGVKMKQQDSGGGNQAPSIMPHDIVHKSDNVRTDSPDNDSAFSDTVSMLSSESSASSGGSGGPKPPQLLQLPDEASRAKAEKIRMAMEKIKEANIQKLFVKVFSMDGCSKSLLVDEKMNCNYVTRLLADKNHVQMDPKWGLIEHLPELFMERVYEDHELLVDNLMLWTRDSKNTVIFSERPDKIQLFMQPERFLLSDSMSIKDARILSSEFDEHSRNMILEEYFSATSRNVPEVEGPLYLKADSKKGWKKYHFVLRASGLYYYPKEKAKSSADLVCLTTFDNNHVYYGIGWKKKFKAPTDYTFAVKLPQFQEHKATKHIRYLCAEDTYTLQRWMVGIRVAKYGRQLLDNYRALLEELAQEDLDKLAHARSCSVSSIAVAASGAGIGNGAGTGIVGVGNGVGVGSIAGGGGGSNVTTPTQGYSASEGYATQSDSTTYTTPMPPSTSTSSGRHSRASSSSSSGCLSDASVSTPTSANGFDTEFPTGGTIKRKPAAMKPSLPLTSITRQLKEVGEGRSTAECVGGGSVGDVGGYTSNGTLTRRHSRRKSNGTDDGSNSGTLKRQHSYKTSRGSIESVRSGSSTPVLVATPTGDRTPPFGSANDRPAYDERPASAASSTRSPTHSDELPLMTDSILSLPPLPGSTYCHDPSIPPHSPNFHHQTYFPCPTDIYNSTMSLDSLPPPPNPNELPSMSDEAHLTGSQLSLMSLPPPPPSPPAQHLQLHNSHSSSTDTDTIRRRKGSSGGSSGSNSSCCTPTNDRTPVRSPDNALYGRLTNGSSTDSLKYGNSAQIYENYPKQPLSNSASFHNTTNGLRSSLRRQIASNSHYSITDMQQTSMKMSPLPLKKVNFQESPPSTPQKRSGSLKKISFNLPCADFAPVLPKKPSPPKRADSTRLTSPKKLVEPPKDFLKDLQRVMRKKWQVAQKCKEEPQTTPHEVLGFRDPPVLLPDYKETNVSNWVQEHYGPNNFYENVYNNETNLCDESVTEYATSANGSPTIIGDSNDNRNSKRPPPPPPKRSETTHLSSLKLLQH